MCGLDSTFAALADPTRRAILGHLAQEGATVGELAAPFGTSLPAISRHLGVLERASLIARRTGSRHVDRHKAVVRKNRDAGAQRRREQLAYHRSDEFERDLRLGRIGTEAVPGMVGAGRIDGDEPGCFSFINRRCFSVIYRSAKCVRLACPSTLCRFSGSCHPSWKMARAN